MATFLIVKIRETDEDRLINFDHITLIQPRDGGSNLVWKDDTVWAVTESFEWFCSKLDLNLHQLTSDRAAKEQI